MHSLFYTLPSRTERAQRGSVRSPPNSQARKRSPDERFVSDRPDGGPPRSGGGGDHTRACATDELRPRTYSSSRGRMCRNPHKQETRRLHTRNSSTHHTCTARPTLKKKAFLPSPWLMTEQHANRREVRPDLVGAIQRAQARRNRPAYETPPCLLLKIAK